MDSNKSIRAIFCSSIQAAIDMAYPGEVIVVPPGRYLENLDSADNSVGGVGLGGRTEFRSNIVMGNSGGHYGGITVYAEGHALLEDNRIIGNRGEKVGGISLWNSQATIKGNTIDGNMGEMGGVSIDKDAVAVLEGNSIANNQNGGVCLVGGTVYLGAKQFKDNVAGAIHFDAGWLLNLDGEPLDLPETD